MTPTDHIRSPSRALQVFLMTSYAYYIKYTSLIDDSEFDKIANYLLNHINDDNFQHQHKYLVTEEMLKAGTAYNLSENDYPLMIKHAAAMWIEDYNRESVKNIQNQLLT